MYDLYSLSNPGIVDFVRQIGGAIVVYRPVGGIGDAAMILPAITGLRKKWGDVLIIVVCIDYIDPVFRHHPDVDVVVPFTSEEIGRGDHHFFTMECQEAGSVIYRLYEPDPATIYEAEYGQYITKSRQSIFSEACEVKFRRENYKLQLTDEEKDIPRTLGLNDRYIILHLRSHDRWRDYHKITTKALLSKLYRWGKKRDIQVVTVDSTLDFEVSGVRAFHHMHLNTIFGVINGAMLLIGPDSSMVHVAGVMGQNVLGIFGPTNPMVRLQYNKARWIGSFPRCKRQYCWYRPCSKKFCLSTLRPGKIANAAINILETIGGVDNEDFTEFISQKRLKEVEAG